MPPHDKPLTVRLLDDSSEKGFALKVKSINGGTKTTSKNGSYFLRLDASSKQTRVALLYTGNSKAEALTPVSLTPLTEGGAGISPEVFEVEAKIDSSKKAWVVDQVPLPPALKASPYKGKVRMSDVDFFSDGNRALLSTWDGDIWMLTGLKDFKKLTWKRYATGFFEPLGLKIVNDVPHIAGRDGIYATYDLNNDGEADKFKVFNNDVYLSNNFHEFQFGLETDKEGNFYFAKASPVRGGGRGFEKILPHNGAFVKISSDGNRLYTIGTGLRAPGGIGVGPNGEITSGENEGTWQPRCKINYYEPENGTPFFGVEDARQGNKSNFTEPLCYLPMSVDNSGGGQIWVPENAKIGIASGELIHLSYGQSAIYHVLRQKVGNGLYQGGVAKLPVKLSSSAQRAVFHPDGSMYVVGFRGWQTNAANEAGLQRIRRNYKKVNPLPTAMVVTKEGIKLTFDVELDDELGEPRRPVARSARLAIVILNPIDSSRHERPRHPEVKARNERVVPVELPPQLLTVALTVGDFPSRERALKLSRCDVDKNFVVDDGSMDARDRGSDREVVHQATSFFDLGKLGHRAGERGRGAKCERRRRRERRRREGSERDYSTIQSIYNPLSTSQRSMRAAAISQSASNMTSCASEGSTTSSARGANQLAVSSKPSRSTTKSSAPPSTNTGTSAFREPAAGFCTGSSSFRAFKSNIRSSLEALIFAAKRATSSSLRLGEKKHSRHNRGLVPNAFVMKAYVIFKLVHKSLFKNRFTISPFPLGGTLASKPSPDTSTSPSATIFCATNPPNECPNTTGAGPSSSSPRALRTTSPTSRAWLASVPAVAAPGVVPLAPCPRSDTDVVSRPRALKYPAKCSS